ncbi:hypothetical protein Tco_0428306 [Tanacetum coccineum]
MKGSISLHTHGWDKSSSTLNFCLFGFDFQCLPALPSLSDSASILQWPRLSSGLPDMLQRCLDPSLFLRSLLLLGVPDSECLKADGSSCRSTLVGLHRKQACLSPTELAPSLTYSSQRTWVG